MSQTTPAAAPPTTVVNQGVPEPLQAESPVVPQQHYSIPRRIRANLDLARNPDLEATIARALLAGVLFIHVLFFQNNGSPDRRFRRRRQLQIAAAPDPPTGGGLA